MIESSPTTRARSHTAADAGLPRGVNPEADRGDEPALLAPATAWEGLTRGWRMVGFCGRGSQSRQKPQPSGHPCFLQGCKSVSAMQSLGQFGAVLLQRAALTWVCPMPCMLPLDTSRAPDPGSGEPL